ncbi:DeoR/GlpR family DNA-binding transcription regulator [Sporosarcina beigongshangi]|uniref:DeoR/GlpR family DNA-binding transcription regulator n=1 Tax=Sporosarcina beigongshangi TaxID=2782538 RepID=UPI00193952CA|nr:DeoR/GlpR family DNA-binding transcription regulator [Sporosarcina beigongshangi]
MLAAARHQKIIELLDVRSTVRVTELSDIFSVTEETIRRDLEKLEKEKKLLRSHGGAMRNEQPDSEIHFSEREIQNVEAKRVIAEEAVKHVVEGDRIILDASTTAWYMAKALPNISIAVITNSIKIAIELGRKDKIEVISTGGKLLSKSLSYVGPLAERSLDMYHVNKTFISCKGFHLETGLSDSSELQALLKKRMIQHCDYVILMVDSTKFDTQAFSYIASIGEINEVITDNGVTPKSIQTIEEKNIKLTIVPCRNEVSV